MVRIHAFQGLRPAPEMVSEVACVPYDVVDRDEACALADRVPNSLLRVDRAEIDLPPETDPYSEDVYQKALANFLALQTKGALLRESEPCVYLYQQRMGAHVQTGLAAVCHVDDYENGILKKHEETRPESESDRTHLIHTLSANTGPVLLTYRDTAELAALATPVTATDPLYRFHSPDRIEHTVWRIPGGEAFRKAFEKVPVAYVADGHNRTASAVRVARERREANPKHTGNEEYNWFLAVLFPSSQLQTLPYNRVVRDLNGLSPDAFRERVSRVFSCKSGATPSPGRPGDIRMYLKGQWFSLSWTPPHDAPPVSRLDVTALQSRILAPILNIEDPRTSKRIDFIGGVRGTSELVRLVDTGKAAAAFSLFPTTVEQLMSVADAGQIMPPKSTCFEPKLRSGLFIHTF